nr:hypothetical protein [Tanacetum cinerariifolium]
LLTVEIPTSVGNLTTDLIFDTSILSFWMAVLSSMTLYLDVDLIIWNYNMISLDMRYDSTVSARLNMPSRNDLIRPLNVNDPGCLSTVCLCGFPCDRLYPKGVIPNMIKVWELGARHRRVIGSTSGTARSRGKDRGFPGRQDERVFPTVTDWRTSAPKDEMPAENTYSPEAVMVKTVIRPCAAHEVPLLIITTSRVIEIEDPAAATDSSRVPSTIERSPLDFANEPSQQSTGGNGTEDQGQEAVAPEVPPPENVTTTGVALEEAVAPEVPPPKNVTTTGVALEVGQAEGIAATGPRVIKECRKRGNNGVDTNAPPKMLRRDHLDSRPTQSTIGGKSLAAIGLGMGSTCPAPTSWDTPVDVSDTDPLSFADPQSLPTANAAQSSKGAAIAGDLESKNTSFTSMVGSSESIYRPKWGVTNGCLFDASKVCQDIVDHIAPPVAMGSQLRLRFEQEAKLLNKSVAQVARRDKRIKARGNEIKNLETLLKAETDMKKTAKAKNAKLGKELENLRALFSDLQMSNDRLSQQVSTLQAQVTGEEKLKAAFEEFKQYEDNRVKKRSIASRRWVIGHGLRLAVMKCGESTELRQVFADVVSAGIAKGMGEGLKYGVEHGNANLSLEAIEAYDPEAETKYIAALHALKDLKYPMVDQLESLKDAPIDVIMASLHLESDTGYDAPQWIHELRLSSSQLKIPMYPEVRDPTDPWACKEEILLVDAIAANVSRAEKKKKRRVVCRTHGVGSGHNARSDGVPVSVSTVAPQGLAILLTDTATQTETSEDGASPRLLRSSSLPAMHN